MTRIPPAALLLGLAGLIPFIWAALLVLGVFPTAPDAFPPQLKGDGRLIMLRYGGIILPFMAGVLWGFATRAETQGQATAAFFLSVIPALWWFFMAGQGAQSDLINLAIGFVSVLVLDFFYSRWELAPRWWLPYRIQITAAVLICLAIGAFA